MLHRPSDMYPLSARCCRLGIREAAMSSSGIMLEFLSLQPAAESTKAASSPADRRSAKRIHPSAISFFILKCSNTVLRIRGKLPMFTDKLLTQIVQPVRIIDFVNLRVHQTLAFLPEGVKLLLCICLNLLNRRTVVNLFPSMKMGTSSSRIV